MMAVTSLAALAGCSSLNLWGLGGGGTLAEASADGSATLTPAVETSIFRAIDENTADIFLTDLPAARLADPRDDLHDLAGSLIHIRVFLVPSRAKPRSIPQPATSPSTTWFSPTAPSAFMAAADSCPSARSPTATASAPTSAT